MSTAAAPERDAEAAATAAAAASSAEGPVVLVCVGMAGSGKTAVVTRIIQEAEAQGRRHYGVNLDPACLEVPFPVRVDIRDTVSAKSLQRKMGLGPNGAIVTSLNLFATRVSQLIELLETKRDQLDLVVVDTPGQIECFTWSASGSILLECFASSFPTVLLYVSDLPRCTQPRTFVSSMLYAVSVLYRTRLPLITVLNKCDVVKGDFAEEWMTDFEVLLEALDQEDSSSADLSRSICLSLDEFYRTLTRQAISAKTGEGVSLLIEKAILKREEYINEYRPERERVKKALEKRKMEEEENELERVRREREAGGEEVELNKVLKDIRALAGEDED